LVGLDLQGGPKKVIPLEHYITLYERYHFFGPPCMIFGLVFVSRDFEVGTNVSCEELTVSPRAGLILFI